MRYSADLMLIMDEDGPSLEALRAVATRLGCDRIELSSTGDLPAILATRRPTIAVLAIDRIETDGYGVLQTLAEHGARPATLLIGTVDARVLASVRRAAEARGLPMIGTRSRPLDEADLERLLAAHMVAAPPTSREELVAALAEREFSLLYQPKIALASDTLNIQGVEALVRWQHPRRGQLQPRQFLDSVEAYGLVGELTDFVMTEAIRQAGVWRQAGMSLQLVINLSPRLVKDREFPDRLASLLRESDVPADQVVLDVNETAGAADRDLLLDVFTRLRILGVGLSLDDFGTGLSSLTELYRMPFSEIKIDRSLLADVAKERDAEVIVTAIANLAHSLNISICGEGVETREMLDFIRATHFDSAQGRLFCEPVAPCHIERLVAAWPETSPATFGVPRPIKAPADDTTITRRLKRLHLASTHRH